MANHETSRHHELHLGFTDFSAVKQIKQVRHRQLAQELTGQAYGPSVVRSAAAPAVAGYHAAELQFAPSANG